MQERAESIGVAHFMTLWDSSARCGVFTPGVLVSLCLLLPWPLQMNAEASPANDMEA